MGLGVLQGARIKEEAGPTSLSSNNARNILETPKETTKFLNYFSFLACHVTILNTRNSPLLC